MWNPCNPEPSPSLEPLSNGIKCVVDSLGCVGIKRLDDGWRPSEWLLLPMAFSDALAALWNTCLGESAWLH